MSARKPRKKTAARPVGDRASTQFMRAITPHVVALIQDQQRKHGAMEGLIFRVPEHIMKDLLNGCAASCAAAGGPSTSRLPHGRSSIDAAGFRMAAELCSGEHTLSLDQLIQILAMQPPLTPDAEKA